MMLIVCATAACIAHAPSRELPPATRIICIDDVDSDRDFISDACELALARAFAPTLDASADACNIIRGPDGVRLGGGYLFAVQPADDGARIAYLPAYFLDCGWSGIKCVLPVIDCRPHVGDSELILIDAASGSDGWTLRGIFLSAHCFGRTQRGCRWYRGAALRDFEWTAEGRAVVRVADGRNANYPSARACDEGHLGIDSCASPRVRYVFPTHIESNIGSRARPATPGGCISAQAVDSVARHTVPGAVECMWRADARFRGWQASGDGVTPYERYLREIAGW
jgi:hypothetical protein